MNQTTRLFGNIVRQSGGTFWQHMSGIVAVCAGTVAYQVWHDVVITSMAPVLLVMPVLAWATCLLVLGDMPAKRNAQTPIFPSELERLRAAAKHLPCALRVIDVHIASHGTITYARLPALCALLELIEREEEARCNSVPNPRAPDLPEVAHET